MFPQKPSENTRRAHTHQRRLASGGFTLRRNTSGFTLLEILLVVAALAILAGIVATGINPNKQLADARNAERRSDIRTISDAIYQYSIDNKGQLPPGVDPSLRMLGTATEGCTASCGGTGSRNDRVMSDDEPTFDEGDYYEIFPGIFETEYDDGVILSDYGRTNGIGRYTSPIFDAGDTAMWTNLSWLPLYPSYKELPNDRLTESGYPIGNANMSGNILLLHMNELLDDTCDGTNDICDTSGNANHGRRIGATLGATGRLGTGVLMDGNDRLIFPDTLNPNARDWSVCTWFKWDGGPSTQTLFNKEDLFAARIESGYLEYRWAPDTSWRGGTTFPVVPGQWYHACIVYDHTNHYVYRNGVEIYRRVQNGDIGTNTDSFCIGAEGSNCNGDRFNGTIDELAVFERTLEPEEVEVMYLRGAVGVTFDLRSCAEPDCGDKSGFDTSLNEMDSSSLTPPSFSLTMPEGRYFQYRTTFETQSPADTPVLMESVLDLTVTGENGEITDDVCLDLSSSLMFQYLVGIPEDPTFGSPAKTYYAVKRSDNGRLLVEACGVEQGEQVSVTR